MHLKKTLHAFVHKQWQKKGCFARLLYPLSRVVAKVIAHKQKKAGKAYIASVPVIVIGNIFIGGTGKTPFVIALTQYLQKQGLTPGIISRGYGIPIGQEARTAFGKANPYYIGDEPSLLAQYAPVSVHPNRQKAIEQLLCDFPNTSVIISDDGLQHIAMGRDMEIIVQDNRGIGNGYLLPAGPLREPASRLNEVDVVVTHYPTQQDALASSLASRYAHSSENTGLSHRPHPVAMYQKIEYFEHLPTGNTLAPNDFLTHIIHPTASPVMAMAGIGNPSRFYTSLQEIHIPLDKTLSFNDHHPFSIKDFKGLEKYLILMTSKDATKCRPFARPNMWVVHAAANFIPTDFLAEIAKRIQRL